MAHSKQALKRHRQSEEKRIANKTARTRMKSAIKRVLASSEAERQRALADAMKRIDKAAKAHAIHANAAARYKSRVARALRRTAAAK
jgi:small subunit ribosomal protein S20